MGEDHSWAVDARTRAVMRGNRSRDTSPELAVRRALHRMGLRFRVSYRPSPTVRRTADIVFTKRRVAVFIDGCFWHGCPDHYVPSKTNKPYWDEKIKRNSERDAETTLLLNQEGWLVLRFWSHESPDRIANAVYAVVSKP